MLYVVPTPIGNLEDITLRALRLLNQAQIIITEDSRFTRKLLDLLDIPNKPRFVDILRNHQFNQKSIDLVLDQLQANYIAGQQPGNQEFTELVVLLVTDAGTPGISDPGREIILDLQRRQLPYTVLPGPDAAIPALVASGFASKEFHFLGFIPTKKGRQSTWQNIIHSRDPMVIYESVHRIQKFLQECQTYLQPDRQICVCKDISKKFERIWVGCVREIDPQAWIVKGEFAVVVDGYSDPDSLKNTVSEFPN